MFDSGFGGLTVARALMDLLPGEDLVYLGDTGRYPYGPRPMAEVARFAHQITEELVERHGVKLVVVACNTAAAAALGELRDRFDVPIVGVIDPGVRSLAQATRTGRVGVIGTVGTINSGAYQSAVAEHAPDAQLTALACPGFVEFVERGACGVDGVAAAHRQEPRGAGAHDVALEVVDEGRPAGLDPEPFARQREDPRIGLAHAHCR